MTTNVPSPTFGPNGFIVPSESVILAGVLADQQQAFGGNLNPALETPQGQLATSETAIIGDKNDKFLALANGVDPALASGRMQDAIGRIYFIERNSAQPTVVSADCTGLTGTVIPAGARAQDQAENIYIAISGGVIGISGTVLIDFSCTVNGPISCPGAPSPGGFLNTIYQAIPGWDSINNPLDGIEGNDVESRAAFEDRRRRSVALNALGSVPAVQGAVLQVSGILDAYVTDNKLDVTSGASFTASIAGTTMTVSAVAEGTIEVGQTVTGSGIAAGTVISSLNSGTGATGTYTLNNSQTISSRALLSAVGGIRLAPHSLYVAAFGGSIADITQAIWSKKSPGCNYNGTTSGTVVDSNGYSPPYPSYVVSYTVPTSTSVKFAISMQQNASVPSDAIVQIQNAVIASFVGADGGARARIGSYIFASRYYANIAALGPWVMIFSIKIGLSSATVDSLLMQIDQFPTVSTDDISVSFA